jgi:hypothetical protein
VQGSGRARGTGIVTLLLLLVSGCEEAPLPELPEPRPSADLATRFDPSATGTITGRLTWSGPIPDVPLFHSSPDPLQPPPREPMRTWKNPLAPLIHSQSWGVEDAVVFLRGVDVKRARPWDHPPARVEFAGQQMQIRQGEKLSRHGFVRCGTGLEIMSEEPILHVLRARGTAFFSLPLVDQHRLYTRFLRDSGIVELSEGVGRFWMRAFVFVDEHPYFTRTDAQGGFRLEQVPEGEYELAVFLPSWHLASMERDPGLSQVSAVTFQPPLLLVRKVQVNRKRPVWTKIEVSARDFEIKEPRTQ